MTRRRGSTTFFFFALGGLGGFFCEGTQAAWATSTDPQAQIAPAVASINDIATVGITLGGLRQLTDAFAQEVEEEYEYTDGSVFAGTISCRC